MECQYIWKIKERQVRYPVDLSGIDRTATLSGPRLSKERAGNRVYRDSKRFAFNRFHSQLRYRRCLW